MGLPGMEDDWLVQAAKTALWFEERMSLANASRLGFIRRRVSRKEKARNVAECQQPDACLTTVARDSRVLVDSLRCWVRLAGAAGVSKLEREDLGAQLPFVPVGIDDLPSEQVVEIEADGVIVRLPANSSAIRIVAVAAYLGRLA